VRSTPTPNPPVSDRVFRKTPLVRVTSASRLPRPYQRRPKPKTKEDLHEACLEALRIRMSSKPVALSQEAMRSVLDPRYRFGSPRQPAPVVGGSQEEACHPQPLEPCRMLLSASARAADGTKCGRRPKERRENATPNDLHGRPATERPACRKKLTIILGRLCRRTNSRRARRCRSATESGSAFARARLTNALHCSSGLSSGA
jgi:hypothetical protein